MYLIATPGALLPKWRQRVREAFRRRADGKRRKGMTIRWVFIPLPGALPAHGSWRMKRRPRGPRLQPAGFPSSPPKKMNAYHSKLLFL